MKKFYKLKIMLVIQTKDGTTIEILPKIKILMSKNQPRFYPNAKNS